MSPTLTLANRREEVEEELSDELPHSLRRLEKSERGEGGGVGAVRSMIILGVLHSSFGIMSTPGQVVISFFDGFGRGSIVTQGAPSFFP
jgi:hypothetical protein